jgi:L-ascorbate metabolism protein UlaG (beta-lactamase superfamily)
MPWMLDPRCELGVLAGPTQPGAEHEDLGCGLQGPASRAVRRALDPLRNRIRKLGEPAALAQAAELVEWAEQQPAYDALCTTKTVDGRRRLKTSALYGDVGALAPRVLQVRHGASGLTYAALEYATTDWASLHDLVSALQHGATERALKRLAAQGGHESLVMDLISAGWLSDREDDSAPAEARAPGLWFVGHNTVLVASKKTRLLIDPWFRPWRDADPADYKPLRPVDLGPIDGIAITHSHGDHFHLGSLLAYPRDTPIFVPRVERESILATDLEHRLGQVGFTNVKSVGWWESVRIGDIDLHAMPFYGEQASTIALVDPALRNVGNTWLVSTGALKAAFLADTGRDPAGSMQEAALQARRKWGAADVVFGGMRGFSLCPLMLPFTTLDAMFVNVPIELLAVRQRLMNDGSDLLAVAEVLGAKHVVPYADGGAPWYYREGMGPAYLGYPAYPGEREAPLEDQEDPRAAPFPERLAEIAEERTPGQALTESLLLRPGDIVRWSKSGPQVGSVEGFAWPYAD